MAKRLVDCRAALAAVLLLQAAALGYNSFVSSFVQYEAGHVAAGLTHLNTGNFSIFNVNPPLYRLLAALPLSPLSITVFEPYSAGTRLVPRWEYQAEQQFLEENPNDWMNYVRVARIAPIGFALTGSVVCYLWAAQCFGRLAGIIAATLFATCPYVLGHGCLVEPDVPAAAIGAAAMYHTWQWLRSPRWFEALLMGLVLGLAELCKYTLLIFYPLLPLLWIAYCWSERRSMKWRSWRRQAGMLSIVFATSIVVINCGYLLEGSFRPLQDFRFRTMMFTGRASLNDIPPEGDNRFADSWLGKLPVPLPANMVQGIDTQRYDFERGLPSYLRGEWAPHGWWYFYLYAAALKLPLGTSLLMGCAVTLTILHPAATSRRDEMVILAPALAILLFVSSQTGFSIHSRYIIPALPFLFVWTSKVARVFEARPFTNRNLAIAVAVALIWSVGSSLAIYPHSLSYFNELAAVLPTSADATYPRFNGESNDNSNLLSTIISAGPRNGPAHLLDSNIDWGQDLLFLKEWLDEHPDVRLDGLACYGSYPASLVGIPNAPHPPFGQYEGRVISEQGGERLGPEPGWYAVSVNYIYGRHRQYSYFLRFQPVAMAGYSIYIFHITPEEANRVRRQLKLPQLRELDGQN